VLAAALALLGTTSAVYLIAVAAMAGDSLEPRLAMPVILLATAVVAGYSAARGLGALDWFTQTLVTFVVGLFSLGASRLAETNRELVAAREELALLAVVDERLRFARDLHDLLGHSLTVIRAKSELASRLAPVDATRAGREMAEVEGVARQALIEVREAVTGYRRPTLAAEIANACAALGAVGIAADVAVDGLEVTSQLDEALGWVLREAVTNVIRHSGAGRCRVEAVCDARDVRLEVADNGRGPPAAATPAGNGLTGVRERLAAVGGRLELDRAPDGGFRLVARVPRSR
jgi:two-component system sensor histidine kinase DesK